MSRIILIVAFLWLWPGMAAARTARLVKEGIKLLNNARYALAIGKFKEAYADDNTLTRALLLSGVCHLNLDQIEDAITAYERFEREERPLDPDDQARLLTYYEEAERRLTRLLPIGPARKLLLGRAAAGRGQLLAAQRLYEEYAAEKLSDGERAALREHRLRLAVRYRARVEPAPGSPERPPRPLQLGLLRLLVDLGEWQEALTLLAQPEAVKDEETRALLLRLRQELLAEAPPRPERPLLVGYCHLLLREEEAALSHYEGYLRDKKKGAPDGPFEAPLRALLDRAQAAAEAQRLSAAETKKKAEADARENSAAAVREQAALRAAALLRPAPPSPRPVYKKWWFWTAIGGGAALAASAVVLGTQLSRPQQASPETTSIYKPEF